LNHLEKALKIEARLQKVENAADTHLNMCAVLSQLGNHEAALEHAQSALILLQEELFAGSQAKPLSEKADRISVLAIAYHNIGVEQEFLKKSDGSAALNSYRKGVNIAEQHLGPSHGITITLRNSCIAAKKALALSQKSSSMQAPKKKSVKKKPKARTGEEEGWYRAKVTVSCHQCLHRPCPH